MEENYYSGTMFCNYSFYCVELCSISLIKIVITIKAYNK